MYGGLLQLVAYGSEDIIFNINPEFSFFKCVYYRYTNFSMESIENLFTDKPQFGTTNVIKIKRYGDLINNMYLEVELPYNSKYINTYWTNRIGFNLLKKIELYIGKKLIDSMYGVWCHIWVELTHTIDKKKLINKMVGNTALNGYSDGLSASIPHCLNIPLFFSFCRHPSQSLPHLALRNNQEITLKFFLNTKSNCIQKGELPEDDISHVKLWVNYIYLDTIEQNKYIHEPLVYLIETTQSFTCNLPNSIKNILLPFNLRCKELMWIVKNTMKIGDKFTNFTSNHYNSMIKKIQFKFNSLNVFSSGYRTFEYFNYIIPYGYHTGCPDLGINTFSFSLYPELLDPSGVINFNNLTSANIIIDTFEYGILEMFSFNYKILSFDNGNINLL